MFAIIKTGGKQYKVQVGETIDVEKLDAEEGAQVRLDRVLLAANDGDVAYGQPLIDGAVVTARVVRQHKGDKLIVFRYKSKSRYRRRTGHRQKLTQLAIQAIDIPGWETATVAPSRAATSTAETAAPAETTAAASELAPQAETAAAPEAAAPAADTIPTVQDSTAQAAEPTVPTSEASGRTSEAMAPPAETTPAAEGSAAPPADVLPVANPQAQVGAADAAPHSGTPGDTSSLATRPGMEIEEPPTKLLG